MNKCTHCGAQVLIYDFEFEGVARDVSAQVGDGLRCNDPHLKRGSGSAPFDGEGLPTVKRAVIDRGVLVRFDHRDLCVRGCIHGLP